LVSDKNLFCTLQTNSGLKFLDSEQVKVPLLAHLGQDLLSASASKAYVKRVLFVCGQLTAGNKKQLIIGPERSFVKNEHKILWIMTRHTHTRLAALFLGLPG